jgi:hypothetical protein
LNKLTAYSVATLGGATVSGVLTWLVNDEPIRTEWAPIVSAAFGAFFAALTIGRALHGWASAHADPFPLSRRARWILGGIGAAIVVAFALLLPKLHDWTYPKP